MISPEVPFQISIDKATKLTIHNRLDSDFRIIAAVVLDKGVWTKHIGPNLAGEGDILLLSGNPVQFVLFLLPFNLEQLRAEPFPAGFLIGKLVPLDLAGHNNPRRKVSDADSRLRLIDILSSGSGRVIRIHPEIFGTDFDID